MSNDPEPPYIEASISAEWKVDVPDGTGPNDLYTPDELEEAFVDQLGLNRDTIVDDSVVVVVNRDVTWSEDE